MIGFLRLAVFGFIALSIVYLLLAWYSRSVQREELEKAWDTDPANEGAPEDARDAFIEDGMRTYQSSLRRKLIVLVYVIPIIVVGTLVYLTNV
jgi:Ca2+/Na+ antiporter